MLYLQISMKSSNPLRLLLFASLTFMCCTGPVAPSPTAAVSISSHTVIVGDTVLFSDHSFCNALRYACRSVPSALNNWKKIAMHFDRDSLGYFSSDSLADSLQWRGYDYGYPEQHTDKFDYDTTKHLTLRMIFNSSPGTYVVSCDMYNLYETYEIFKGCMRTWHGNDASTSDTITVLAR